MTTCTASLPPAPKRRVVHRETPTGTGFFLADWTDVLMIHFEVDPVALQQCTPFPLDLHQGRAFVSTVAFTMYLPHR